MRVLVCGGRDFSDELLLRMVLSNLMETHPIDVIIHGAARGADSMAGHFARFCGIDELRFPADWDLHGRAAGPIRNRQMLTEGRPDLVIAFPGREGTADMIKQARRAGVEVRVIAKN